MSKPERGELSICAGGRQHDWVYWTADLEQRNRAAERMGHPLEYVRTYKLIELRRGPHAGRTAQVWVTVRAPEPRAFICMRRSTRQSRTPGGANSEGPPHRS